MNSTTQTAQKEKSILKKVNKELKKSRRVAVVSAGVPRDVTDSVSRAEKAVRRRAQLKDTHLQKWAQALAYPFSNEGAICPVNFNPAPSIMTTTGRLTHTNLSFTVSAGTTVQMLFFPGHGAPIRTLQYGNAPGDAVVSNMDAQSYHYCGDYDALLGAGVGIGPLRNVTSTGATQNNVLSCYASLPLGTCQNAVASTPMRFDNELPYSAAYPGLANGAHLRWQMVSSGVRIFNTTPQLNRGGNVVSVQLVNGSGLVDTTGASATLQGQLDSNPTFKTHGDASSGIEVAWIPRLQDLAYWHSFTDTPGNTNVRPPSWSAAAFAIFLNNSTSQGQTYTIQCVYNMMFAGTNVQSISTPAVVEPSIRAPVEQTIVHLQNTSSTARVAPIVADAAAKGDDGSSMFERLGNRLYSSALDLAHSVAEGAASGMARASYFPAPLPGRHGPLVPRRH